MARKETRLQGSQQDPSRRDPSSAGIALNTPPITETHWTIDTDETGWRLLVVCVYWQGPDKKYPTEYVHRLQRMVERNLHLPHDFVCLTDTPIPGVECYPLESESWDGWWNKVSLFNPDLFTPGQKIIYLDLDVIITGDIDILARQWTEMPLTMIYNFGPNRPHCAHNSSVMSWFAGDERLDPIYEAFGPDVVKALHGDQCWIWRVLRQDIANWPQQYIKSYKYDCRGKAINGLTRIVVFHGDPKPHQVSEEWAIRNWI